MVIVEDFDDASDGNKSAWLNLLDGGFSFDRVCFIATTNFLDKIDSRFTNRPSRFDRIIEIECPDSTDRANYFISKIPDVTAVELSGLIAHTNGMTYAQMREVIVWTQCLQRPIGDVVKHIQDMEEAVEGE